MKWWIVLIALAVNIAICYLAAVPILVTWVHDAPHYIKCAVCDSVEAREAIAAAVSEGRMQVTAVVHWLLWPIVALCMVNLCLIVAAWWRLSPNKTMETTQ